MNEFTITKTEIGVDKWPFIVDEVIIEYRKKYQAMFAKTGNLLYGLNGFARDLQDKPLEEIWLDDPDIPGTKISITFIFRMCRARGIYREDSCKNFRCFRTIIIYAKLK